MRFIGQSRIWTELEFILPELRNGRNLNILIRAPSGYGKTKLAASIANSVDPNSIDYNIPDDQGKIEIDLSRRIIIIDEVHTLEQPETIYPIMDSNQHIVILCSNEFGELKEPLVNRCVDLVFQEYSLEEIMLICYFDFQANSQELNEETIREIASNCNLNPRIARQITQRLSIIFRKTGVPTTANEVKQILSDVLQIEDGLNPLHRRYLDYLSKVRRASLDSIIFATRIDRKSILREIEPILLQRNLITISSKGRQLIQ